MSGGSPSVGIWAALELGIAVPPELRIAELWIIMTLELGIAIYSCSMRVLQLQESSCTGAGKSDGCETVTTSMNRLLESPKPHQIHGAT